LATCVVLPAATGLVCWAAFFGFGRVVAGAGAAVFFGFGRAVGAAAAVDFFGFDRAGAAVAVAFGFGGALVGVALFAVALAFATGGLAITLAAAADLVARLGGATGAPARLTTTLGVLLRDEATETFESAVFRPADAPRAGVFISLTVRVSHLRKGSYPRSDPFQDLF
jgi:hypothetical protein